MKCDRCEADVPFFDLQWDGTYQHADGLLVIHKRKRWVCPSCLERHEQIKARVTEAPEELTP